MDDSYLVIAYILAGILVVVSVYKYYVWAYDNDMDPDERREFEILYTPILINPAAKALVAIVLWTLWPLLAILAAVAVVLVLCAYIMDGYDWIVYKIGKLIARIKA